MTSWQCHRLAAALVDYAEGTLAATRRSKVERHLAACADCAATVSALHDVPQALRAWPEAAQDAALLQAQRAGIRAAIDAAPPPHAGRLRGWRRAPPAAWPVDGWTWPAWRLPATALASGLLSIMVLYSFVVPRAHRVIGVGALDDATLVEVHDVTYSLSPHGEWFPSLAHEAVVLPSAADAVTADESHATVDDLADEDLQGISDLLDHVS